MQCTVDMVGILHHHKARRLTEVLALALAQKTWSEEGALTI